MDHRIAEFSALSPGDNGAGGGVKHTRLSLHRRSLWVSRCWGRLQFHALWCAEAYAGLLDNRLLMNASLFAAGLPVPYQRHTNNAFMPA
mmetsp:Transcript_61975/g.102907  ORF Transcript_61975/g.102907 Transcript_61975/m.102907 type:complete len:89 (+) Transcript_61975:179-445(+)